MALSGPTRREKREKFSDPPIRLLAVLAGLLASSVESNPWLRNQQFSSA